MAFDEDMYGRFLCRECKHFWKGKHMTSRERRCPIIHQLTQRDDTRIHNGGNICKEFTPFLSNIPKPDFEEYQEFLADFYRNEKSGKVYYPYSGVAIDGVHYTLSYECFRDLSFIKDGYIKHKRYSYIMGNGRRKIVHESGTKRII